MTAPGQPDRRRQARSDPGRARRFDAIYSLARAGEAHDAGAGEHVMRIRRVVELVATALGLPADQARAMGYDAMLHDVGKLDVPRPLLRKPEALTDAERGVMRTHTVRGESILSRRPGLGGAAAIARHHHERFDGTGYPDGLAGDDIPLGARITAAADVLDALMSSRVYKDAWTYEEAFARVCALAGTHLDPRVIGGLRACNAQGVLASVYGLSARCAVEGGGDEAH